MMRNYQRIARCSRLFALALIGALANCSAAQTNQIVPTINTTLKTAQSDLASAVNFYRIVKGVAQVAIAADPVLAAKVSPVLNELDMLLASAETALVDTTAAAPALEALAAQLQTQAATVLASAAPAVKVVSNH